MRTDITSIYRIETQNSVYEIKVIDNGGTIASVCKKMGKDQESRRVQVTGTEYLDRLVIGASFDIPGVVLTSRVQDYSHFELSSGPKRTVAATTTIPEFFQGLTDHIVEQVQGGAVMVAEKTCGIDGCTVTRVPGLPSHEGSRMCKSGSVASGGTRAHCACDYCY